MVRSDGAQYVQRRPGEELSVNCTKGTVKHGGRNIMVWGCIAASGCGRLYKVDGIMRADQYVGILQNVMLPSMSDLFGTTHAIISMHDNDPKHTAKKLACQPAVGGSHLATAVTGFKPH